MKSLCRFPQTVIKLQGSLGLANIVPMLTILVSRSVQCVTKPPSSLEKLEKINKMKIQEKADIKVTINQEEKITVLRTVIAIKGNPSSDRKRIILMIVKMTREGVNLGKKEDKKSSSKSRSYKQKGSS